MSSAEVSLRYARALFNISSELHREKEHLDQLNQLTDLFKISKVKQFISMPQIDLLNKYVFLDKVLQDSLDATMLSFVKLLIKKKLTPLLPEIRDAFCSLVYNKLGLLSVSVTTAIPLDKEVLKKLKDKLEKTYKKNVIINEKHDPLILGGARIVALNKVIDFTLKSRFLKLKNKLLSMKEVL